MTIATIAFVLLPLMRRRSEPMLSAGDAEQEALIEQRAAAYDAMDELDADRELGKLNEEDYRTLHERYRRQAVAALKATREREAALTARIEQQVRQARLATSASSSGGPTIYHPSQPTPSRRDAFTRSVERKPAVWLCALSVLFVLFASATVWVWTQGSRTAASARPVGTIPGDNYSALIVDSGSAAWALSGDSTGIRRSTDGGATWSAIPVAPGQVTGLAQDADRERAYALVDGRLLRSRDGGKSWQPGGSMPRDARLTTLTTDPEAPGRLYALDQAGALFSSANGGDSWARLQYRPAGIIQSLTVASSEPLQLFGAASGQGVVSGADGSWASANGVVNGALPTDVVHSVVYDRSSGATSVLPSGETRRGTLYAATDSGVFRSTDYGQDWFGIGPNADIQSIAIGPPGSRLILAVSSSGDVYRSTDGGINWSGE